MKVHKTTASHTQLSRFDAQTLVVLVAVSLVALASASCGDECTRAWDCGEDEYCNEEHVCVALAPAGVLEFGTLDRSVDLPDTNEDVPTTEEIGEDVPVAEDADDVSTTEEMEDVPVADDTEVEPITEDTVEDEADDSSGVDTANEGPLPD